MSLIFARTVEIENVMADADATPSIVVIRLDTMAEVYNGLMTRDALGAYSYTIASPVVGVTYRATITYSIDGSPIVESSEKLAASALVTWYYGDQQAVVDILDELNLTVISNLNPNQIAIDTARLLRAGLWADAEMNRRLNPAIFIVPLINMDETMTQLTRDASARYVAWWLYQNRGIREVDPKKASEGVAGWFQNHKTIGDQTMKDLWMKRSGATTRGASSSPIYVPLGVRSGMGVPDVRRPFPCDEWWRAN